MMLKLTKQDEEERLKKPPLSARLNVADLIKRWSLFHADGLELRKQLHRMSQKLQENIRGLKKQKHISDFFKL